MKTNILVASVSKDNDWKTTKRCNSSTPVHISDFASICHCISFDKVIDYEDDEISNGDQCNYASILEGIKSA